MATKASAYFTRIRQNTRRKDASEQPLRSFIDLYVTKLEARNKAPSYIKDARRILLADFSLDGAKAYALYAEERNRLRYSFQAAVHELVLARRARTTNI